LSLSIVVYALLRYLQRAGVEYVTVTQIIVYPIKSCGAVHLTAGEVPESAGKTLSGRCRKS